MAVQSFLAVGDSTATALAALREQIHAAPKGSPVRWAAFFADARFDAETVARSMVELFPEAHTVGASAFAVCGGPGGAVVPDGISVFACDGDHLEQAHVEWITGLSRPFDLAPVRHRFCDAFHDPRALADPDHYVGVALVNPLTGHDATLLERWGDRTDTIFVGGSSSDRATFDACWVAADGRVERDAAVLTMLKPRRPFLAGKLQSFKPRTVAPVLTVTEVDARDPRVVWSFNGRDAAAVYAETYGFSLDNPPDGVGLPPVGVMAAGELFVRDPMRLEGRGVRFFCRVPEGQNLCVLDATDQVADLRIWLEDARRQLGGSITGILEFLCYQRHASIVANGVLDEYVRNRGSAPTGGFVTFGEAYLGYINCTSTWLLFG